MPVKGFLASETEALCAFSEALSSLLEGPRPLLTGELELQL